MKIDSDLARAVKAAVAMQPDNRRQNEEAKASALKKFLAGKHGAKIREAARKKDAADKAEAESKQALDELGLSYYGKDYRDSFEIDDEAKFRKAGGDLPAEKLRWSYDSIMAELAASKPADRDPILKKYGIDWS